MAATAPSATETAAPEWSYTDFYPYIYSAESSTWYYVPATPQLAWDYTAGDWGLNPLEAKPVDVAVPMAYKPLDLSLKITGGEIAIAFNELGGLEKTFTYPGYAAAEPYEYTYAVDRVGRSVTFYGHLTGTGRTGDSFTVVLEFEGAWTGHYTFMGYFASNTNPSVTQEGSFDLTAPVPTSAPGAPPNFTPVIPPEITDGWVPPPPPSS